MGKKRNCRCQKCGSFKTQKRGSQNGKKRFFCTECRTSFLVNHRRKELPLWIPHIDGIPTRKLGNERGLSGAQIHRRIETEMNLLPENNWFTKEYCSRFSGILIVDGKYVKVKGYEQKIPFIYGLDYLTHDAVVCLLAPSENEEAFMKFFRYVKTVGYPLKVAVTDDRSSLVPALNYIFPKAKHQLCHNHFVENIRTQLTVRTQPVHRLFFGALLSRIFIPRMSPHILNLRLREVMMKYAQRDVVRQYILLDIFKRKTQLFNYTDIPNCPKDTNLIELFNSHLEARLKSVKGFQSFESAARWLNAYVLRRRTKSFTDCSQKFKHLNGKCSLEMTLKKQASLPEILAKYALEM